MTSLWEKIISSAASEVEEVSLWIVVPITYHLIKDYGLKVNILRATIDPHKQGRMVVELTGDNSKLSQGLNYLERTGVEVEPLAQEIKHLEERCISCTACVPICPTSAQSGGILKNISHSPNKMVSSHYRL